ncbi:MAG: glycine betaine/L-proline ABC transporter ATP-binding protein [Gammaproteobacteria bacterium]|nr:glycine betaine/L-proline ABC transporter ATP-binding protein [Gammaproteobacteria bacterium]
MTKDQKDKLVVENVYKVFGPEPERAFDLLDAGKSKDEILKETGLTIGVQDTSFNVRAGEIFVVMGLSGSGKSTLVRMLNRLIEPTRGEISVDGEKITRIDPEKVRDIRLRKMAMVFQHFALFPHMTVAENVGYGLKIQGFKSDERRDKAMRALEQVGLDAWADSPPNALSGGMQQRVGLARGLAVDPEILLMDEPFSALDPLIRRDMQRELLELQQRVHKTIVFITHDLNEALILGDRIAIMKEGRFVQVGTPQDIVSNPADDYVAAFTQDIDRGRVFTAEYVLEEPCALSLDGDSPRTALEKMKKLNRHGLYVLDDGRIAGVVTYGDAAESAAGNGGDLKSMLRGGYPTVSPDKLLYEVYEECSSGLPIAVLDDDGTFRGVVDPLHVFAKLTADTEQQASSAADRMESRSSEREVKQ